MSWVIVVIWQCSTHIGGGDLDSTNVLLDDPFIIAPGLNEERLCLHTISFWPCHDYTGPVYLYIMLCKLFRKRAPTRSQGVYRIIDCDLAVFVIQKLVDVLAALAHNLLAEQNR